jgi:8-oxo-dGTP pyrophosphatase MutT (NUDIX family)
MININQENRIKSNECVFSRHDISTVLLYRKRQTVAETQVVVVKEFRSPVSNQSGYVWELPGGSSFDEVDYKALALEEVEEETGFALKSKERLKEHDARQLMATMSAHKAHLYSVELSEEELDHFKTSSEKTFGVATVSRVKPES